MTGAENIGKLLIIVGIIIAAIGCLLLFASKLTNIPNIPWIGKLPGDIFIKRENFTFYFPLATSILVSIGLTLLLWLIGRK